MHLDLRVVGVLREVRRVIFTIAPVNTLCPADRRAKVPSTTQDPVAVGRSGEAMKGSARITPAPTASQAPVAAPPPMPRPMGGERRIGVLLADDAATTRALLRAVIAADSGLELVGCAVDATEAIAQAELHRPDVALIDVEMPGGGGPVAAREIAVCSPDTRIIALSGHDDRDNVIDMLRAGAVGYLLKSTPLPELRAAVRRAAEGEKAVSPELVDDLLDELADHLTREQRERDARLERAGRVRRVLDENLIAMVFQPLVDLETGRAVGFEALARVRLEPVRGPDAWFADAAASGLLEELDLAALRAALTELDRLPGAGSLWLNLSPGTAVSPRLYRALEDVAVGRLVLEITEHARVEDYDVLDAALAPLRARGLRLAVDDAGAGFASLRHILRLAPDVIKVDMTVTRGIDSDQARRALTSALVAFGSETGALIVAEGIETQAELEALRGLGVGYGQGYLFGRPEPLAIERDT